MENWGIKKVLTLVSLPVDFDLYVFCRTCMPLLRIDEIEDRQKGLKFLNEHQKMVEDMRSALKGLPDIEKLMSAIHSAGVRLSSNHPENRAVYYELASNAKAKISRLLTCLEGLTTIEKMVQ